jgi:type IV pilus assembly protein PilN
MVQWSRNKKADAITAEIQSVDIEIKKMGLEIRKVEEFKRQKEDLETKLNVILQLKVQQKGPVHVLDQLASAIPPRLWMKEFSENGSTMTIVGSTADHSQISAFMDNLEKSPFFSNVELGSAMVAEGSKTGPGGQLVKAFQLSAAIQIPKDLN